MSMASVTMCVERLLKTLGSIFTFFAGGVVGEVLAGLAVGGRTVGGKIDNDVSREQDPEVLGDVIPRLSRRSSSTRPCETTGGGVEDAWGAASQNKPARRMVARTGTFGKVTLQNGFHPFLFPLDAAVKVLGHIGPALAMEVVDGAGILME